MISHSAGKIIRTHCVKNKHQANGIFGAFPIIADVKYNPDIRDDHKASRILIAQQWSEANIMAIVYHY